LGIWKYSRDVLYELTMSNIGNLCNILFGALPLRENLLIISTVAHLKYMQSEAARSFSKGHGYIETQKCHRMVQASENGKLILVMGSKRP
jgi:hypothetical protein